MTSQSLPQLNSLRLLMMLSAVGVVMLVAIAPASAQQRDPFDPLVSTGSTTDDSGSTTGSSEAQAETGTQPATETAVEETSLPNTGSGMSQWLAVAYVLVAVGAGLLVLTRTPFDARNKRRI